MPRHEPRRTCVACRTTRPRADLLRFVARPGETEDRATTVVLDPRKQAPGRGAWVCPEQACIDLVTDRDGRPLLRTLRIRTADEVTTALDDARTHLAGARGPEGAIA